MKKSSSLKILSICLILLSCSSNDNLSPTSKVVEGDRPNILWIVAEDLSPIIPSFGDSTITTPNLSRLAAEGTRYTHVFSSSGVCAPSRAAIAIGMYQNHFGAQHMRTGGNPKYFPKDIVPYEALPPAEAKMHSQYFREAGYYTSNNSKEDYQFKAPITAWNESSRTAHWRNRKPGQPFFSIVNLTVTHESQVWNRQKDSLWVDADLDVPVPPYLPDNEIGRRDIRQVYSNIKQMDHQVGEILAELEEDGLLDNTIIFWYSDHGGPLPRQKRLLYDSGMRLPLIVRFPDKRAAGEIDDQLISFIDFKPTILSLAGIPLPSYLDGRAFLGDQATSPKRDYVHGAADRFDGKYDTIRAVRDARYKYLRNYQADKPYYLPVAYREQMAIMKELLRMRDAGELNPVQAQWFRTKKDKEELFDTVSDPHELVNLAADPQHTDKLSELSSEMDRWIEQISDQGLIPENEFLESIWPGKVQPVTADPVITREGEKISITSSTEGANIGYQIFQVGEVDQDDVTKEWEIFQGEFDLSTGQEIRAIAHRIGFKESSLVTYK